MNSATATITISTRSLTDCAVTDLSNHEHQWDTGEPVGGTRSEPGNLYRHHCRCWQREISYLTHPVCDATIYTTDRRTIALEFQPQIFGRRTKQAQSGTSK